MNGAVDWSVLERLRALFLEGAPLKGAYWRNPSDLASYDATFGERIGWKWDAVLRELQLRGWSPPAGPLLDFGCGSGVAGRRVLAAFGADRFSVLRLHDRSALAVAFAREQARAAFPGLAVEEVGAAFGEREESIGTLVVSHVLSELPAKDRRRLVALAARARAVIWVEPGTHADSRALIAVREELRPSFRVVAPCTHGAVCGLLAAGNERHWCHHFAKPPWEVFTDPDWAEFASRLGIDLRSLPYSFLVLEQALSRRPEDGRSRVLGEPRFYKGYARVFSCAAEGVRDLRLQKRTLPDVFARLEEGGDSRLFRWETEGEDIVAVVASDTSGPTASG